jgi:hypothetical protein
MSWIRERRPAARAALLVLAVLVALPASAPRAHAQAPSVVAADTVTTQARPRAYRRWLYMALGAALVGIPAYNVGDDVLVQQEGGFCATRECYGLVGAAMGGIIGFMIGRELDQAAGRRAAETRTVPWRSRSIDIEFAPSFVRAYDGGLAVGGRDGLATMRADGTLNTRADELRGIADLAVLPGVEAIIAATPAGLFAYPLTGMGEGRMVVQEGGSSLTAVGGDQVVLGESSILRRLRFRGTGAALQAQHEGDGASLPGALQDAAFSAFTGVLWVVTTDRLVAYSPQRLQEVGSVQLPVEGRSLAIGGTRALITAGTDGVLIADISQPAAPRLLGHVRGLPFAFRAALSGDMAYIASGRNGLVVLNIADPVRPDVVGTMRNLGAVHDVAVGAHGEVYALSRELRRLHIVTTNRADDARN